MAIKKSQIEKWIVAQKKHRLSDTHVQMARELGLNPDKLGKIDNHRQESWKAPLPEFIEEIFYKRFKKERPDIAKPPVHSGRTPMERRVSNGGRVCRDMGIRASGRACHARMLRLLRLPPGTSAHIATGVQTYFPSSAGGQGL